MAQAETINLYAWQNHSWDFVSFKNPNSERTRRDFNRIRSNAGNLGFRASVDTGMAGIKVNMRCEQFIYLNEFAGGTGWCNRNSKIGLAHPQVGEIMLASWLLPYYESVSHWVDPFNAAGAESHTGIMGSVGANTAFYNTGDFDFQSSASTPSTGFSGAEFNLAAAGYDTGFNRRQENIIQYWSPNWNGFVFRYAQTAGNRDGTVNRDEEGNALSDELDPVIRSSSLAYTNGPLWLGFVWQQHKDWTAVSVGEMSSSDAESYRLASRYIADFGDGASIHISVMYEDLEYEFNGVSDFDLAMDAFGYRAFDIDGGPPTYGVLDDASTSANERTMAKRAVEDIKIEREAWMIAGIVTFGGPLDFRFSYMEAEDLEISCGSFCTGDWQDTAADSWNIGLFYTMPAGTQLRLTYSEVDNDANGTYGQGSSATGLGTPGAEVDMFSLGIAQKFD